MPCYLKNSCKAQVSGWNRQLVITVIWIILKQTQHLKTKFWKRNLKLKNPTRGFTGHWESRKKKYITLFELLTQLLKFKLKDMTELLSWRLHESKDNQNILFLKKKKTINSFILTWSALLDLATVPDEFSLLPVFLNKQIPPTYQYLRKTLKIWVGKKREHSSLFSTSEATLLKGQSKLTAIETPNS